MSAFMCMFDPKLIFGEDVLAAKLASLPVNSLLIAAGVSTNVLIAFLELKSHPALPALGKQGRVLALAQQMLCEFTNVDVAVALLAKD